MYVWGWSPLHCLDNENLKTTTKRKVGGAIQK